MESFFINAGGKVVGLLGAEVEIWLFPDDACGHKAGPGSWGAVSPWWSQQC